MKAAANCDSAGLPAADVGSRSATYDANEQNERCGGGPDKDHDKLPAVQRAYRRCAITFLAMFFGGIAIVYMFLLLTDPYDTGRFPTLLPPGVTDMDGRTAAASRGRDPRFNAAIFGNSRTFMLDPERLSQATGLSFASLATPAAGPRQEMVVTRYFLRIHPAAAAIVFGMDEQWCSHDPSPQMTAFPFWLYGGNLEYLANLLSTRALQAAQIRVRLAMGFVAPTDPRGFFDYEAAKPRWASGGVQNIPDAPEAAAGTAYAAVEANTYFPALEAFDGLLAELPAQTRFAIIMTPLYYTSLPRQGSQEAADLSACKAALSQRLGSRGVAFLDYQVDGPMVRDPRNFMDRVHYRRPVARVIEDGIIAAFGRP